MEGYRVISLCFILRLLSISPVTSSYAEYHKVGVAIESLLEDYYPSMIPTENDNQTMKVELDFLLVSFNNYDEVSGSLSVTGKFEIRWQDHWIKWKPDNLGGKTEVDLPSDKVWKPVLHLVNPAEQGTVIDDKYSVVRYDNEGNAFWQPVVCIKAMCTPDLTRYPQDSHTCDITFTNWGYSKRELKVFPRNYMMDMSFLKSSNQWHLENSKAKEKSESDKSMITFSIIFKRIPDFFYVNLFTPIFGLAFVNLMVFLLPVESGERVSFCLTVLLAFAVYMTIVADNLPQISSPVPEVCYTLLGMFLGSATIAFANIIVIYIYHKDENDQKPSILQHLMKRHAKTKSKIDAFTKTYGVKKRRNSKSVAEKGELKADLAKRDSLISLYTLNEYPVTIKKKQVYTWKMVSRMFDKIFFAIFLTLDITFLIVFSVLKT